MVKDVILFDGECAWCDGWVRWVSARDRHQRFRAVGSGSPEGVSLRTAAGVPPSIDSVVLIRNGKAYVRSAAAWRILWGLPGWTPIALLLWLIPGPVRDLGYDLIARNRHRLGGRGQCVLPPEGRTGPR